MTRTRGRTFNLADVTMTTVEINSVGATKLLDANDKRLYAIVSLDFDDFGVNQECVIREFAALVEPTVKKGELLTRIATMNRNLFNPIYRTMVDNPYAGEISAITNVGIFNVHVIEGFF